MEGAFDKGETELKKGPVPERGSFQTHACEKGPNNTICSLQSVYGIREIFTVKVTGTILSRSYLPAAGELIRQIDFALLIERN